MPTARLRLSAAQRAVLDEVNELVARRGTPEFQRRANAFIAKNRGLALSFARRYQRHSLSQEDLNAVAMLGLWEAVTRWDPSRARCFSTYALARIRCQVQQYVREQAPLVKVPTYWHKMRWKIQKAQRVLGEDAAPAALAAKTGLSEQQVRRALELDMRQVAGARLDCKDELPPGRRANKARQEASGAHAESEQLERIEPTEKRPIDRALAALEQVPELQAELQRLGRGGVEAAMARIGRDLRLRSRILRLGAPSALPRLSVVRPSAEGAFL